MPEARYDVAVIGGGSGGFGAALAAARLGLQVLLVEKADTLGGTSVKAGVSVWEMGCGGTGVPFDVYRRLKRRPQAVGIYRFGRHCCWPEDGYFPGGEQIVDPALRYLDTLCRNAYGNLSFGVPADKPLILQRWHGIPYEPAAMAETMAQMLAETGRVTLRKRTGFRDVEAHDGRIDAVTLDRGERLTAPAWVDATGDASLCAALGCTLFQGQDPRSRFGEPAAPEEPSDRVNGVTLIFRATRKPDAGVDAVPPGIPDECWWRPAFPVAAVTQYPNGDLQVNMLPTMEGREFLRLGQAAAYAECRRRVLAFWRHHQRGFPEWQAFRLAWTAPALGIRETRRTLAEHVLTQHDLEAGLAGESHPDIVALCDHVMDVHGAHHPGTACRGVHGAYGIPYRCLVPKGFRNLLVACRAAGFSSLAASSCRLQRVMMTLGQAAGTAVFAAREAGVDLCAVPPEPLRALLRSQHVQLEHPIPEALREHLQNEEAD